MVSFRRIMLAIAVLAVFAGLASAQVNVGGSYTGPLSCQATSSNPTSSRQEGYTELQGDIVITCVGGTTIPTAGTAIPTTNITVALVNTLVTSRVFSNGLSEALLLIDEPGVTPGTSGAPVIALTQNPCGSANGAGFGGCPVFVEPLSGTTVGSTVSSPTGAGTTSATVPNVFQGIVSGNQVIFNGIPVLAPVTAGFARIFRITNVRANANQFSGASGQFQGITPIQASVTAAGGGMQLPVAILTTSYLFQGLGATAVRNAGNSNTTSSITGLLQCATAGLTPGAVLRFPEGFANAFKTRVNPTATVTGASTSVGANTTPASFSQNLPGQFYLGSESGFIAAATGGTAGLADFGTRLKATFNNVPSGVNIFVSTTNINPLGNTGVNTAVSSGSFTTGGPSPITNTAVIAAAIPAGIPATPSANLQFVAGLVLSETATVAQGGFLPLATGTNNSNGVNLFGPLPVDANGTATAVWEVMLANPTAFETAEFAVFYSFTGNPATNTPPTTPAGTVSLSFAPTFTSPTSSTLIPRFAPASTSTTLITVTQCTTTLLFPFVNSTAGFDTGIAIANTSKDPFGTKTQDGPCTLYFFGSGAGTPNTSPFPSAGGNIVNGTLNAEQVSNLKPGFQGYVIATCNFQLAHGYALFSDTGIRNWATGYLAIVLPTAGGNRNTGSILQGPGVAGGGVEGGGH